MRKEVLPIVIITLLLITSASAYVYVTSQDNTNNEEDVKLKLNESGELVEITSIDEYNKIIKPGEKKTNSPVTPSQLKDRLYEIFKDVFGNSKIEIQTSGPYLMGNGSLCNVAIVCIENNNGASEYIYYIDANYLPENTAKGKIKLTHTFGEYVWSMVKSKDITAKISQEAILQKAKEIYASHFNASSDDKYDIELYKGIDNTPVYRVNVNNGKELMIFNANTGELLLDIYQPESKDAQAHTQEECLQRAQQELDSKGYDYASNLSLQYANKEEANDSLNYTFNIVYKDDNGSQVIGSIKVDAYTLDILSFDISEPTIQEEDNSTEVNDTADDYGDNYINYGDDDNSQSSSGDSNTRNSHQSQSSSSHSSSSSSRSSSSSSHSSSSSSSGYSSPDVVVSNI